MVKWPAAIMFNSALRSHTFVKRPDCYISRYTVDPISISVTPVCVSCRLLAVLAVTDPVKDEAAGVIAAIEVNYAWQLCTIPVLMS